MIEFLRPSDDRFNKLPNFPYKSHYMEDLKGYNKLRMHYIDEGSKAAAFFVQE